jgi:hypothetical protein
LAREKRERSAAKSDDAEVPEYLWMEHLFDDGSWNWCPETREQVTRMTDWFRSCMLRRWKRNVLRSFLQSLHQKFHFEKPNTDVIFEIPALGSDPRPTSSLLPTYVWSSEGLGGKTNYRHWWL